MTPQARAAVAQPQTPRLSTPLTRLTAEPGGSIDIPVQVYDAGQLESIELTADVASSGVATAIGVPQAVAIKEGQAMMHVKLPEHMTAGHYDMVVSLRWRSDIRIGMPGPCTRLIHLAVGAEAISEMSK